MNTRRFKDKVELGSESWISYTDLMSGLVIILFLIATYSILHHKNELSYQKEIDEMKLELAISKKKSSLYEELVTKYEQLSLLNSELLASNKMLEQDKRILQEKNEAFKKKFFASDEAVEKILEELKENILAKMKKRYGEFDDNAVVIERENKTLHLNEKVLKFDPNKDDIKLEKYVANANIIADSLYEVINSSKYSKDVKQYIDSIFIEGNTDENPVKEDPERGNWKLSAGRASSLWLVITKRHSDLKNLKNNRNNDLFAISGYADSRPNKCSIRGMEKYTENGSPVCKNPEKLKRSIQGDLDKSNGMDRRIDIRITPFHDANYD